MFTNVYSVFWPSTVLQLAVSMDYSIFLLHRFADNRSKGMEVSDAMVAAVKQSVGSVASSGLTTVTGFAALILMSLSTARRSFLMVLPN